MNPPSKYMGHVQRGGPEGYECRRCKEADGPLTMCRIGRRLYIGWFNALDDDSKMFALVGMPEVMRKEVLECAEVGELGEIEFGDQRKA